MQRDSELFRNLTGQPESLRRVAERQFGAGREALMEAAARLRGATHVVFTGMGSSLFACVPAACRLAESGVRVCVVDAGELVYTYGPMLRRGTAIVLVSRSGETVEILKLLAALEGRDCTFFAVTNEPKSTLGRLDGALVVGSDKDQLVALQTYSGSCAVLTLLAHAVTGEIGIQWRARLGMAADAIQQTIDESMEASEHWPLADARVVYVLGRGYSMGSSQEGALLLNETARTPSVSMSPAQFRHGPVEVVDESFRAFVFATNQATAELDNALARDIEGMGGWAWRIAPAVESLHADLYPLVEIVPVQVAACRLAAQKGIPSGAFRYASLVTATESGFEDPAGR